MLPHLSFVAEFSKAVSVLIVLVLLALMMTYLSRVSVFPEMLVPGNSSSVTWVQHPGVSQQTMLLTPNPFQLQVEQASVSATNATSVVAVTASSDVRCKCVCWWGVDLRGLHTLLTWPWPAFRDALLSRDQSATPGISLFSEPPQLIEGKCNLELQVPASLLDASCLGAPPRLRCPLVVTLLNIPETSISSTSQSETTACVVALVSVVHIRDELVTMPTCVLNQFLKQSNGQVTTLQPLYVSGISNQNLQDEENEAPNVTESRPPDNICCVVCHVNSASLALLPCRHACLCPQCLPRLSDCPLCRTRIHSYFYVVSSNLSPHGDLFSSSSADLPMDNVQESTTRLRNVVFPS